MRPLTLTFGGFAALTSFLVLVGCGKDNDSGTAGAAAFSAPISAVTTPAPTSTTADEQAPSALAELIAQQMLDKGLATKPGAPPGADATLKALVARDSSADHIVTVSGVSCFREPGAHGGMSQTAFCKFTVGESIGGDPESEAGFEVDATVSHGVLTEGTIKLTGD